MFGVRIRKKEWKEISSVSRVETTKVTHDGTKRSTRDRCTGHRRVERTHKFRTITFPDIGPSHTPRKAYLSRANILIRKKKIYAQQREKTTTTTTMRIRKSKTKERIARYNINVPRESQQSMIRQTCLYFKTKNNRSMMMCARMTDFLPFRRFSFCQKWTKMENPKLQ